MRITADLDEAVAALRSGSAVAYPTETFYGLGVDATDAAAIAALAALKGRPEKQPFPVLLPDAESLRNLAELPPNAEMLIRKYWPGPLTVILKARSLPSALIGPTGGIGFRVSAHPVAAALLKKFDGAVTATSANRSGGQPARTATEIREAFAAADLLALDGGETPGGLASTVVDFTDPTKPFLVRQGPVAWAEIESAMRG